jgi:hypothetical protein
MVRAKQLPLARLSMAMTERTISAAVSPNDSPDIQANGTTS